MTKFAKIFVFILFFIVHVSIYAQNFYKATPIPKEKINYIEESVDSANRDIQFDQSFMVCLKKDCFYIIPNKEKKDGDDYRSKCSVNIIDEKYNSKKDIDLKEQAKIDEEMDEKTWRPHIPMWHIGISYEALMNNFCVDNPTVSSIAFINEKENERPIILVALNMGRRLKDKDSIYAFYILSFDGVKYRPYLNEKLEKHLDNKKLTVGKNIMVVKHEIEKWLKNNKK